MKIWNINVNSINFSFCSRICSLVGANLFPFIRLKTWVIFGLKFSFLLSGSGQSKNRFGFKRFREIERHEKNDKIRKRRRKGSLSAPIGTVLVRHFLLNRLSFSLKNKQTFVRQHNILNIKLFRTSWNFSNIVAKYLQKMSLWIISYDNWRTDDQPLITTWKKTLF